MTEGEKWSHSMARAKAAQQGQPANREQANVDSVRLHNRPATHAQGGNRATTIESSLADSGALIPEGLISLLAEKFAACMEGPLDLAPVRQMLLFMRNTPVLWSNTAVPQIVRAIENTELKGGDIEEKISWSDFIKYFSSDPRHSVRPTFGRQPFDSVPRDPEYEQTIDRAEEAIKKVFQDCMDEEGKVTSGEFFDKLSKAPIITSMLQLHIGPVMPSMSYLPLTIKENIQKAAKEAPEKMDFKTFTTVFRKVQYPPGALADSSANFRPLVSDRSEKNAGQIRRPYRQGDQSSNQSLLKIAQLDTNPQELSPEKDSHLKLIGWAELLFPKSYRVLPEGHFHTASHPEGYPNREGVDPHTYLGITHPSPVAASTLHRGDSMHIGGPVLGVGTSSVEAGEDWRTLALPKPHPLHPVTSDKPSQLQFDASDNRHRLEDRLTTAYMNQMASTVETDRRREAIRRKIEEEEKTKQAKEAMYSELKAKYQKRLESSVHGSKTKKTGAKKVPGKEGDRRQKMQEVIRLQEEGLENKLSEEDRLLLKEALLLKKMGKL